MPLDSITLENFRCFRERQTARLAPLTLLVGENSTGKTSFMALIRALLDAVVGFRGPDFKEDPYDLGSFDEIVHHSGAGHKATTFEAGFDAMSVIDTDDIRTEQPVQIEVIFGKSGNVPVFDRKRITNGDAWIEEHYEAGSPNLIRMGTSRRNWPVPFPTDVGTAQRDYEVMARLSSLQLIMGGLLLGQSPLRSAMMQEAEEGKKFMPGSTEEDLMTLMSLAISCLEFVKRRPFASAPVRSKPRRTYDPARSIQDAEGDYVPMYLADMYSLDRQTWITLKERLESFGRASGLFDEIFIKRLGRRGSEPFQVQVRKGGGRLKGPRRNLIDVGYGVSQVLPVITELLRPDAPDVFLLQQPEVHLHPSAQAALGSLFCQVAGSKRQLVVETHSDHLLDRVRMDIRDGKSDLTPEDVSILFFERGDLDVRIHSLRIDEEGNIIGAPDGYRRFFMEETAKSLGL